MFSVRFVKVKCGRRVYGPDVSTPVMDAGTYGYGVGTWDNHLRQGFGG
jgi:hypothetical protein